MGVLFAAKFYMVPILEELIREYVLKNLNSQTILTFYKQAIQMKDNQVIEACLVWIDANSNDFFGTDDFNKLDKNSLCRILTRDSLMIQEIDVFKAVINWAKFQRQSVVSTHENLREVLCDILPLVRFPLMRMDEFWNLEDICVLDKHEIVEINKYFHGGPLSSFSIVPRFLGNPNASFVEMPNGEMIVRRFKAISKDEFIFPSDKYVGASYEVNRPIEILGFGIYGAKCGSGIYSGLFGGAELENKSFEGDVQIRRVYFDIPEKVRANHQYLAPVSLTGPPTYCGEQGQEKIVCQTSDGPVTFTFEDYQNSSYDLRVLTGQVPEIIFRLAK